MSWIKGRWTSFKEGSWVAKASAAAVVLLFLWLIIQTLYTSAQNQELLKEALERELAARKELDAALEDLNSTKSEVQVLIVTNRALAEQLRQLGFTPVLRPDGSDINSGGGDGSSDTGPGTTQPPKDSPPPPKDRDHEPPPDDDPPPPDDDDEPPPEDDPTLEEQVDELLTPVTEPICTITSMLNLCD